MLYTQQHVNFADVKIIDFFKNMIMGFTFCSVHKGGRDDSFKCNNLQDTDANPSEL